MSTKTSKNIERLSLETCWAWLLGDSWHVAGVHGCLIHRDVKELQRMSPPPQNVFVCLADGSLSPDTQSRRGWHIFHKDP